MTDSEQRYGELNEESRELVGYLRKANVLAGVLKTPEAVWTLSEAVGTVLYPSGFATADDRMTFCREENTKAISTRAATGEDGERFRKTLAKARDLAETAGDTGVMALIDAAGAFHAPVDRFSRSLTEGVFNIVARDDRYDPSTTLTGMAFNGAAKDGRGVMARVAAPKVSAAGMQA